MSDSGVVDGRLLQGAVKALGPMALVTAWLYYIGWVRTNSQARYFGVDPSLLGYSTTDYILRSVTSLFGPVGALLIGLTLLGVAKRRLDERLAAKPEQRARHRVIGHNLALAGVILALIGAAGLVGLDSGGWWPVVAAAGLLPGGLLLLAGRYLSSFTGSGSGSAGHRIDAMEGLIIGLILVVGLFSAGFFYAIQIGTLSAHNLERRLDGMPEIHVFSPTDLELGGGTDCEPVRSADGAFRCRYTGLRLLVSSNDRLFLVPKGWADAPNRYVHVVPLTEDLRIDVRTNGRS